ncbi:hypothetical protein STEG23_032896 [Scotinomys teguina]
MGGRGSGQSEAAGGGEASPPEREDVELPVNNLSLNIKSIYWLGSYPQSQQISSTEGPRVASHPGKKRTQEQPVTLRGRGPSHPQRTSPSNFRRPRSSQSPSEGEDPGAASHPQRKKNKEQFLQRKRIQEHPDTIGTRDFSCPPSMAEMGRCQCKSTCNNIKNKTSPESIPPPTPRPGHCNVDKAEENDLKNSLMKMIEEALEGKMKNAIKKIEEKTNKKLEEINKEIEEKNKKMKEMNKEIEDKNKKWKK